MTTPIPEVNLWSALRALTPARIGLARSGASLATGPLLDFRLAHARARDAVRAGLDEPRLAGELAAFGLPVLRVGTPVRDLHQYLMRPDLGRRLTPEAQTELAGHAGQHDMVFVIAAGLSAHAVTRHVVPLLAATLPGLGAEGWRIAPLVIVRHGRVAVGDAVAQALRARAVAILIGERPGLSAPDSLGAYLTWGPGPHTTDAERNCVSNIRPDGIAPADAAFRLCHLLRSMRSRGLSGVGLKDESESVAIGTD
ncbi:MAG TPA: ethanolamine ammonia-lyase subunit EutC [Xanthobacteraceae bacterium]